HVAVFRFELAPGFLHQILGFGGESDQEAVAFFATEFGEDVGGGVEFERDAGGGLFDLLRGRVGEVGIGHGGGVDGAGGGLEMFEDAVAHFLRGFDVDDFDARGGREIDGAGDEDNAGAPRGGGLGKRVAHLAAGAVGEITNGVDGFLRGAGGD